MKKSPAGLLDAGRVRVAEFLNRPFTVRTVPVQMCVGEPNHASCHLSVALNSGAGGPVLLVLKLPFPRWPLIACVL